jgi:pimeloyl-ACP methyl ester carboxylesterase
MSNQKTKRTQTGDIHEVGSGTPLVLLHGFGGTWRNWDPLFSLLAKRHRVIAVTLPGHQGGQALRDKPSIAALADQLLDQLRAHGIDSAHVVGNSLGGWLAIELARRGFARSVIALSPAGAWRSKKEFNRLALAVSVGTRILPLMYPAFWGLMGFGWGRRFIFKDNMHHGERISAADFRAMLRAVMHCTMLPALLKNVAATGQVQRLEDSDTPIRIAWSGDDKVIPFEGYGRPFLENIGRHDYVSIPNVGHVPMWDDPAAVVKTILDVTTAVDQRPR